MILFFLKPVIKLYGGELFSVTEDFTPSGSSQGSDNQDFDFDGAPLFSNNDQGVTIYPQKDKNGNWYLKVNPPLVDSFNVSVNNNAHEGLEESFNKLVDHFNSK
jgi:dolichyl-phosphate-mannose--protein O-mannosyl transferase